VVVNLEAIRAPLGYRVFNGIPAIYDVLAHSPGAVAVDLPFPPPVGFFGNAGYMLNSTRHWRPILNGYSGFKPAWYADVYAALRGFPDTISLTTLHERGVTHVVVHADAFRDVFGVDRLVSLDDVASLQRVAQDGDIQIYRLR
jgi:hypothetical protein